MQLRDWFVVFVSLVSVVCCDSLKTKQLESKIRSRAVLEVVDTALFKKLILCEEVSSGLACFNRYGTQLVRETGDNFGYDGDSKGLFSCVQKVLRSNSHSAFSLGVLSCYSFHGLDTEGDPSDSQLVNWDILDVAPILTSFSIIVCGIFYYLQLKSDEPDIDTFNGKEMQEQQEQQSQPTPKEGSRAPIPGDWNSGEQTEICFDQDSAEYNHDKKNSASVEQIEPRQCLIAYNGTTFDLNTQEGKLKWRARFIKSDFKPSRPIELSSSLPDDSSSDGETRNEEPVKTLYNVASTINIPREKVIEEGTKPEVCENNPNVTYQEQQPTRVLKKARTDLNIRYPDKPVPSVLDHPMIDKKGKPLRRIFIPGRGWVSAKALEQEKLELISQFDYQQIEPSETLSY